MNLKTSLLVVAFLVFGAALLFTLSAPRASAATTWYVDANVAASGAGTAASPFKTILAAVNAASSGDSIYLKNGTYSPSTNGEIYPISTGKTLYFEGQTQDGVILDPEVANPELAIYMFMMNGNSSFTKMTFTGYYSVLFLTGEHADVTYCTFMGYYDGAMRAAGAVYSLGSGDYSHNIFHDHRNYTLFIYGGAFGTFANFSATITNNRFENDHGSPYPKTPISIYSVATASETNRMEITDNIMSGTDGNQLLYGGILIAGTSAGENDFIVERNTISGHLFGMLSLTGSGTSDFQVSNNYIMHSDSTYRDYGNATGIMIYETSDSAMTGNIYNNVISQNGYGLYINTDNEGTLHYDNFNVTNNTLYDISEHAVCIYSDTYGSSNKTTLNARNNAIQKATNGLYNGGTDSYIKNFTSDHNAFFDISQESYTNVMPGENDLLKDPEFADKDNADYSLNPSSLLIDAGTSESAPTDDIEGTSRPQGRGIDIGAYESIDWSGMFRIGNGYIATAPASAGGPQYKFFKYDGAQITKAINAFNTDWRSEFKVQTADINDDGVDEIVAFAGAGVEPKLRVYKKNGDRLAEVTALNSGFRGGLNAVTGDFNNDGRIEIAVAPANSGGPQVQVYRYEKGKLILMTQFLAYPGTFRGGLSLAAGDTDANGYQSIITAPSAGGGPDVRVYRYEKGKFVKKAAILAYGSGNRDGVNLTSVDMNRDGKDEVITAPINGKSNVRVYREENGKLKLLDWKIAYGDTFAGGVNLSSGDVNADRKGEIVLTPAHLGGPNLMVYQLNDQNKLEKVTNKIVYSSNMRAGYKTAVGDLNDDGTSEIAIVPTSPQTANIQVFTMAGNKLQKVKSFMAYDSKFRGGINLAIGGR